MEKYQSLSSKVGILQIFLVIFALFCCVNAENKTYPTANMNLSPIEQWRSAYYCLKNLSATCPWKYTLNMSGWLNVTHEDGESFCNPGGCADHTRNVLACIHYVKIDFWFANKATVKNLNETIYIGCNTPQGFNGTSIHSSAYKVKSAPVSAILAVLLLALLSV